MFLRVKSDNGHSVETTTAFWQAYQTFAEKHPGRWYTGGLGRDLSPEAQGRARQDRPDQAVHRGRWCEGILSGTGNPTRSSTPTIMSKPRIVTAPRGRTAESPRRRRPNRQNNLEAHHGRARPHTSTSRSPRQTLRPQGDDVMVRDHQPDVVQGDLSASANQGKPVGILAMDRPSKSLLQKVIDTNPGRIRIRWRWLRGRTRLVTA